MKKKTASKDPVTKGELREVLKDYPTKKDLDKALSNYPTKWDMDKRFDEQDRKWDQRFVKLKSDIFTRFDELMGVLAQIREDGLFTDNDIINLKKRADDHDKRLKKLETS